AVAKVAGQPLVTHTWSAGRLVFAARYPAGVTSSDSAGVVRISASAEEGRAAA
ncbi:alpha-D-ribose 1-methylphosphonate 5-triphosphate diphosphatase, partial [Cupriavidus basilensis]|nr:alpha-D-ribose 1-methylphosphonate 5-triphosphate diphosphatase [Cupriavidus basilensis]